MISQFLEFFFPGLPNVRCVFTTRQNTPGQGNLSLETGDEPSITQETRTALRRDLGIRVWQELKQVHGQTIHADLDEDCMDGPRHEGDGLCTRQPGHALVVKTADCQAILLADMDGRHVAALHCGWRGNAGNFPGNGVRAFCARYGLDPARILAVRGPSLGPEKSEFLHFDQEWNPMFRSYFNPKTCCVDLWTLTRNQLMGTGIPARNIYSLDICTASSPQFFSYRREKITGRQAGIIWIAE